MSPHFILCVCWGRKRMSKGEVVRVWKRRWGNGGGESSIESVKDWERELRRIGENPEQDGGRRGQTPGARRLFSPNWQQARAPAEEKCVYPVTQIPLCLCTLCVCGTPAEECDLAHNGYDWSWSPLAPGWMTMQSQKPEQCHIHPLNTSYCISYWNKNKKEKKRMLQGIWAWFTVSVRLTFFCVQYWGGGRMQRVQSSHVSDRSFVEAGVQHLHQILIQRSWVKSSLTENTPFRWDTLIHKCRSAWCCHQEEIISGCEVCGGWYR